MRRKRLEEKVYEYVCENPGKSAYEIAKKFKIAGSSARSSLKSLYRKGLIKFKIIKTSERVKKLSFPVKFWKLLPKRLINQFKKEKQKE